MNYVSKETESYYISWNPDVNETAICTTLEGKVTHYYILLGDHTDEYNLCNTLDECLEYFQENQDLISGWSEIYEGDSNENNR